MQSAINHSIHIGSRDGVVAETWGASVNFELTPTQPHVGVIIPETQQK